ncbi:NAD(P)H-dependent glycerol-3-phosphate dehydrogenase [Novosphingobium sp. PASSN1]|uniref:NAD(P)H-dependent glycerol-3-phosphate dehydrogenase n=1 Tax=Novosphingobium sp. PASSN1 TaxID=2015561 RepID=UPI000BDCE15D|nr:NAD(P)H-dependent glycerol-3-phosphate dehydrogenase [Novosphingobium sp. PASSN1]OYU35105.1 MAG: glycerol-3-phosphate dehydrogenase [Novosphingobium sp. PASSN1]
MSARSGAQVGVIGGGAWGTALAQMLASDGREVLLWAREADVVEAVNTQHRNPRFLHGTGLHPSIRATGALADLAALPVLLMVTPAQHLGAVLGQLAPQGCDIVLCAKGIEQGTGRLMSEVAAAAAPDAALAVLSGPTFAHEVADGLPTAVTLACAGGEAQWARLAPVIARPAFRPYYSADVIGASIGGAVKNVLAIACGVVEGLGLGANARAALISRGFAEMQRLGLALGAEAETLAGLSGLGDLVLTCSSSESRNFALGMALGAEGDRTGGAAALLAERSTVAEGAFTAPVLARLAAERGIAMPIAEGVAALLDGHVSPRGLVAQLLARPLRAEAPLG